MKITFFGHRTFVSQAKYKKKIMLLLEDIIGDEDVEFYLGGYGAFDNLSLGCCYEYKKNHPSATIFFVTPYISESYDRLKTAKKDFDHIIYPSLESIPPKFAITHRNKYMVNISDVVIAYIHHEYGGAYQAYRYAIKTKKRTFNIYEEE